MDIHELLPGHLGLGVVLLAQLLQLRVQPKICKQTYEPEKLQYDNNNIRRVYLLNLTADARSSAGRERELFPIDSIMDHTPELKTEKG